VEDVGEKESSVREVFMIHVGGTRGATFQYHTMNMQCSDHFDCCMYPKPLDLLMCARTSVIKTNAVVRLYFQVVHDVVGGGGGGPATSHGVAESSEKNETGAVGGAVGKFDLFVRIAGNCFVEFLNLKDFCRCWTDFVQLCYIGDASCCFRGPPKTP
jgi:hypothetical protein